MSKQIKFHSVDTGLEIQHPVSASKFVPEWYRKMKRVTAGVQTVKTCVPFLDSLALGYVIPLPVDVTWDKETQTFTSNAVIELNSDHLLSQTDGVNLADGFSPQPHKWINQWKIQTPKGYSCLFVHPLNRLDLPFHSFSGVVDTDKHPLVINFPFVISESFDGVIPAGTPLIQVIPFKRDSWKSKVIDTGEPYFYPKSYEVFQPPFAWYKRKWWVRKDYK